MQYHKLYISNYKFKGLVLVGVLSLGKTVLQFRFCKG